jgi:hypothetical protein
MPRRPSALVVSIAAIAALGLPKPAAARIPHFVDVTGPSGIDVTGLGNASAWIDYNADGRLDLLATNSSVPTPRTWLYRNDGGGRFTDVTGAAGLGQAALRSVAWGDYDDDGWPDLAGTPYGFSARTLLYHNRGDGTFKEVGLKAGMKTGNPWRVTWADYDRDGFLDLYQAGLGADFLYRNNGDGTFTEVAKQAGVSDADWSNAGAWGDYDRDGWPDLFVAGDGADHLYRNNRDGTFRDRTTRAGVSDGQESKAACWGVYGSDGWPDLYVVDIDAAQNHLYRNDGDGTFSDVTAQTGVGDVGDGRSCNWLDADQDGKLDLLATDHVYRSKLFRQGGGGTFQDVAGAAGIADPIDVFNAAWGDFDDDGDLDVFMVGHAGNILYRNDGPTRGYVEADLEGVVSNRSAIGAVVTLKDGPGRRMNRAIDGGSGAYGQDSLTVEFGVGDAVGPFTLIVRWPSGKVQTVTGVSRDSHIRVTEPST